MFGVKKTPKSQKPDNAPIYFHRLHSSDPDYSSHWKENYRQLAILDIGYENLCIRIERRNIKPRRMEPLAYDKTSVKVDTDEENFRVLFRDIEVYLSQWREEYFRCHAIIVEWQLPQNYKAVRISTFILGYFHFLLKDAPLLPLLVEMRSGFKDDYYPILKSLNQVARKAQCAALGVETLTLMDDKVSLAVINKSRKKDDYADVVLMAEVFCRYLDSLGYVFPHYANTYRIKLKKSRAIE